MPTIATCSRGCQWVQSGNRTRHCAACHRTFVGLDAFDRHQQQTNGKRAELGRPFVCVDPATITTTDHSEVTSPVYERRVDKIGTELWAIDASPWREHWALS